MFDTIPFLGLGNHGCSLVLYHVVGSWRDIWVVGGMLSRASQNKDLLRRIWVLEATRHDGVTVLMQMCVESKGLNRVGEVETGGWCGVQGGDRGVVWCGSSRVHGVAGSGVRGSRST